MKERKIYKVKIMFNDMVKNCDELDLIVEKLSEYPLTQSKIEEEMNEIKNPNDKIYVGNKIWKNVIGDDVAYDYRIISSLENIIDKANEETREQSTRDYLTGLFNRKHLNDELKTELASLYRNPKKKSSIMMFDIDYFKKFNDNYGHNAGDNVLTMLSDIVSGSIRDSDTCSRYGGEEFVVLFPDTCQKNALDVAYKINERIANTKMSFADENGNGHAKSVTISSGVVEIDNKNPIWLLYGEGGRQLVESYVNEDSDLNEKLKDYFDRYFIYRKSGTKRITPLKKNTLKNVREIGDFLKANVAGKINMSKDSVAKYAISYVVEQADKLLYHTKNNGRNNVAYMENDSIKMLNKN